MMTSAVLDTESTLDKAKPLSVNQLQCHYQDHLIVHNASFRLAAGEIACLLGPSGCGKTTILRSIAGFHPLSAGEIHLGDRLLSGLKVQVPAEKRRVGMVFQDYALFPHLNVADNITFGLHRLPKTERLQRCRDLLQLVQLEGMEKRTPDQLSGGQQQRVALARALAPRPDLLLLDEPFSSLDSRLRRELARDVRQILKQQGTTAIMVTHDQDEAFAIADQVGIMQGGELLQWGAPTELYQRPQAPFVASFLGQGHWVQGFVLDQHRIRTSFGTVHAQTPSELPLVSGDTVRLWLRPEDVRLSSPPDSATHERGHSASGNLDAYPTIIDKTFEGARTRYQVQLNDGSRLSAQTRNDQWSLGDRIALHVSPDSLIAFSCD